MGRAFVGMISAFLGLVLAGEALAEKRIALVMGNGTYAQSPLSNPPNDAELIAESLRAVGFEVSMHLNANQITMKRAIRDFGLRLEGAGKEAVGLFYYAGHGVQARGANFLIPVDTAIERESDLEIEAVEARWVLTQMEFAGNRLNMVILDACRNNPYRASFRAATRGLARMNAPSGSLVAYSAGPGKVAYDGGGRNSPYTEALAAAMRDPDLDIEDVFKAVRRKVEAQTNGVQTPWEESSLKGDFYFMPQGSKVTVTPPGTPPGTPLAAPPTFDARALELALWEAVKDSADPADFEDYLARYPSGVFSGPAKRRLAASARIAALPPATPATREPERPAFAVTDMDDTYYARKTANVRAGPGTSFDKVDRLKPGQEVEVTGRVKNKDWLRIARADGGAAYVYAPLLGEEPPGRTQVAVGVYPEARVSKSGDGFQDCDVCPVMVAIPPGRFRMGDLNGGGYKDEKPVHDVRIGYGFAVGMYEVTRGEYAAFAKATGRGSGDGCYVYTGREWKKGGSKSWRDPGFSQTDRDPAVCVNWDDAREYVSWLARETGQSYRLLSESEWEYVARAGSGSKYSFGNRESELCAHGNGADRSTSFAWRNKNCDDGYGNRTAPVGRFRSNDFGLYDLHGNVWEWVADCWHESYHGSPTDGSSWVFGGDCDKRVLRGGSWDFIPRYLRAANRFRFTVGNQYVSGGFRVARTLSR